MSAETFVSAIGAEFARYVAFKRGLGRRFVTSAYMLSQLDRFLADRHAADLTRETFAAWSASIGHLRPSGRLTRMRAAFQFCLFRRRSDPACFVPDPSQFPPPRPRPRPHIFCDEEVVRLLRVADTFRPHPSSPLRAEVARLAVVLLYTTGLRRGELVRLTLGDFDASDRVLLVRRSKFEKSRLLPLSADAAREIEGYLRVRRRRGLPRGSDAPLLLCRHGRLRPYTGAGIGHAMRRLCVLADVRTAAGRPPRVHDFRFTFAVRALLRWYREDADVQAKLPALTAYMGHGSIVSTQYYLVFFDAVVQEAAARFARHASPLIAGRRGDR
jgi:integrase